MEVTGRETDKRRVRLGGARGRDKREVKLAVFNLLLTLII